MVIDWRDVAEMCVSAHYRTLRRLCIDSIRINVQACMLEHHLLLLFCIRSQIRREQIVPFKLNQTHLNIIKFSSTN